MNKKVFSLMAVVIFVSSTLNAINMNCTAAAYALEELLGFELDYEDFAQLYDDCERIYNCSCNN